MCFDLARQALQTQPGALLRRVKLHSMSYDGCQDLVYLSRQQDELKASVAGHAAWTCSFILCVTRYGWSHVGYRQQAVTIACLTQIPAISPHAPYSRIPTTTAHRVAVQLTHVQ